MPIDVVSSAEFPTKPINSAAVRVHSGLMFCSGQVGFDKDVKVATLDSLTKLKKVIELGGSALDKVVKYNIYLLDMDDFDAMNEVFVQFVPAPAPARTCIQAGRLPKGGIVEVECICEM